MEPWLAELGRGRPEAAWDRFLDRYRRLIFAAIRHYVRDYDDVMDVFAHVCEALREDELRRLRAYGAGGEPRARFSTWLVVVVHNLTVDWLRARHGRRRPAAAVERLSVLQREIYDEVFVRGVAAGEAYERVRSRSHPGLRFGTFLRELTAMRRVLRTSPVRADRGVAPLLQVSREVPDPAADAELRDLVAAFLASLSTRDRAAVQLYVIDGLPASDVARIIGERGAKAVYNRVYRALAAIRERLKASGISRDDLL